MLRGEGRALAVRVRDGLAQVMREREHDPVAGDAQVFELREGVRGLEELGGRREVQGFDHAVHADGGGRMGRAQAPQLPPRPLSGADRDEGDVVVLRELGPDNLLIGARVEWPALFGCHY